MRLIHTSDWHLGRSLVTFKRYEEFESFLNWLKKTIEERKAEALIIAGDVFDTPTPTNRAQELYYSFLGSLVGSCCRHIIIVAGNHDSPTFLDAPKELFRALNVHVVGTITENPAEEVTLLKSRDGAPQALVCMVPYLRDRDIRNVEPGETLEQKGQKLVQGMKSHYAAVCAAAEKMRSDAGDIPLIATGHLFTAGGQTVEEDGVKELYVGSLAHASIDVFPQNIDYLALGHLHVPQKVAGEDHLRYSGSPLAMGFGEAKQQKQVVLVDFDGRRPQIEEIAVPCFQPLARLKGDMNEISAALEKLKNEKSNAWLEIEYTGQEIMPNLQEEIFALVGDSEMSVVRLKNQRLVTKMIDLAATEETLDDLNEQKVFQRCLEVNEIPDEQHSELLEAYNEIIIGLGEDDSNRE